MSHGFLGGQIVSLEFVTRLGRAGHGSSGREGHTTQYLLRLMHFSSLISPNEVGHGFDFRLLPVRFRFLRVERIDVASHE